MFEHVNRLEQFGKMKSLKYFNLHAIIYFAIKQQSNLENSNIQKFQKNIVQIKKKQIYLYYLYNVNQRTVNRT